MESVLLSWWRSAVAAVSGYYKRDDIRIRWGQLFVIYPSTGSRCRVIAQFSLSSCMCSLLLLLDNLV